MIAAVDDGVGEITAALKQAGLSENKMVVFVGDTGLQNGNCRITPHTAGVAALTARISPAGVRCSANPIRRNVRLRMLRLKAFSGSPAVMK